MPKLHRLHVFISHAHADVGVVTALAKLLINSGLRQEDIYCTSLPSHGVRVGVDFERDIRSKIRSANVIIALLSERYYSSAYCMFELGAAWVFGERQSLFPYLLPPMSASDLRGPIDKRQCPSIKDPDRLDELKEGLVRSGAAISQKKWERAKKEFVAATEKRYRGIEYLEGVRKRLNQNLAFQRVLAAVSAERKGLPLPTKISGFKRRDLPAYLEDEVGRRWEKGDLSTEACYEAVGREIMLCSGSEWMWEDEKKPKRNRYWRLFNKLAAAIESEAAKRFS